MHGRAPTCQPRSPTSSFLAHAQDKALPRVLSLLGEGAARTLAACALRGTLVGVGPCSTKAPCASETALILGARPRSDMPAAASNEQPAFAREHMRTRHCVLSLSEGGAARALAVCARRAALVGVVLCPVEAHYGSDSVLSLGARPCSDVPVAASNEQPASACAHTPPHHHTHSLGRRRTTHACDARARRRTSWSRSCRDGSELQQRDESLFRCTALLRRASRGLQRAAGARVCAHANAPPHLLSWKEAHHARLRCLRAAPS